MKHCASASISRRENAVFLDDNTKNTEAAQEFGLHTITVENKEQTDRDLHVLGVTW